MGCRSTKAPKQTQTTVSRVTEQDRAILEVKARMRKLKTYIDKLSVDEARQTQRIYDYLKLKQKDRALIALKHRKMLEKEQDKARGAQLLMEQTLVNIGSAQMDVNVYEALKTGDRVLDELQQKASLEMFEELYDKHKGQQEIQEMQAQLFKGKEGEYGDLERELEALEAEAIPGVKQEAIEIEEREKVVVKKEQRVLIVS